MWIEWRIFLIATWRGEEKGRALQAIFGSLDDFCECGRLTDCQLGKGLAIEIDLGFF